MPRSPNPVRSTAIPGGRQLRSYGDDADNLRYDSDRKRIYVGYGSGALAEIDEDGNKVDETKLDAHPESFQMEKGNPRIYVNLPKSRKITVIDREKRTILATWPL